MNSQNLTLRKYLTRVFKDLTSSEEIFRCLEDRLTITIRDDEGELLPNISFSPITPHESIRHLTLNFFDRMHLGDQFILVGYFFDSTGQNWNVSYDCKDKIFRFTQSSAFHSDVPLVSREKVSVCTNFTGSTLEDPDEKRLEFSVLMCGPIFLDPIRKSPVRFIHQDTPGGGEQDSIPLVRWLKNPQNQRGIWVLDEDSPT